MYVKLNLVPILGRTSWKHIVPGDGNIGVKEKREKLAQVEVASQLETLLGVRAVWRGNEERILKMCASIDVCVCAFHPLMVSLLE